MPSRWQSLTKLSMRPRALLKGLPSMTLAIPDNNPERLLSVQEALEYLKERYGIGIRLSTFYSKINRRESPVPVYFFGRPKFTIVNIDEWVRRNLSDDRK
jgi:predicted DNA-binding transcriptional regulator AlpA